MKMARNRIVSFGLAVCVLLGMTLALPVKAAAAGIGLGAPELVQDDVIGFAGHEWVVLEASGGSATLLLKDGDAGGGFGSSAFRPSADTPLGSNWKLHTYMNRYYPDFDVHPNEYGNSYLQKRIEQIWRGFPEGEQALIIPRDLTSSHKNISGPDVPGQLLWPLSTYEHENDFANNPVLSFGQDYWLRTAGENQTLFVDKSRSDSQIFSAFPEGQLLVRPAFYLDASGAFFTSSVSGGKSGGIGSLTAATSPTGAVKLTVIDPEQTTEITATAQQAAQKGGVLFFGYRDAETGSGRYISCFLESRGGGGDYYGRLTDLGGGRASGGVQVPLSGVADGAYTLHMFSEQINDGNHTDFVSQPVTMTVDVLGGIGTVSGFTGDVISDVTLEKVAGQTISVTGGDGGIATPYLASVSLGHSVDSITDSDLTASDGATARLYADDTYTTPESLIHLDDGANDLYIKVEYQGGIAERYYHVTATRAYPGQYSVKLTANPLQGGNPTATPNPATATQLVTLEANPASGYTFERWESVSPGVSIASPTQLSTTFEMPHNDVEVVAHYAQDSSGGDNGGGSIVRSSGTGGASRSDDSSGASYTAPVKTQIPDRAFSWDGERTLTIAYDGITALGLTGVKWDGAETTAYTVHQGSVIVRFDRDFIGAQSSGEHRVRVEFLNHYGKTAVTVGEGATSADDGPYDDAFVDGTYNPNTGDDSRPLILLALLGCFGGLALAVWSRRKRV